MPKSQSILGRAPIPDDRGLFLLLLFCILYNEIVYPSTLHFNIIPYNKNTNVMPVMEYQALLILQNIPTHNGSGYI